MKLGPFEWSGLGLLLAAPFALLVLKGYGTLLRCSFGPWLGPCADPKAAGWLTFFLGLPWSGAATRGALSEAVLLGAPILNMVLLYNLGRLVQHAWAPMHAMPEWKVRPPNNQMQRTRPGESEPRR